MRKLVVLALVLVSATVHSQTPPPHLLYFGYVGAADDAAHRGLDETKGYTNFAYISGQADLASTFVRDRVTAMSQRGVRGIVDLGLVLWCGAAYRTLCGDWRQRWQTWMTNNQSILSSDKLLAFALLDEPFLKNADMSQYEQAAARIKADVPWAKILLVEAACAVRSRCNPTDVPAFSNYTGTLPNVDWVGLNQYAIHPATDPTYQVALARLKTRFPDKQRLYVMDGYWDSSHTTALHSIHAMGSVAREWYDLARNDPGAVLLGVFVWGPNPSWTSSRDFPCDVLAEHREIGRAITGKTRGTTALPVGAFERIDTVSGLAAGYACDPDGSICENPNVDVYVDGVYASWMNTYYPSRQDYVVNAQCGVGVAYRFNVGLSTSTIGHPVTMSARDLDAGAAVLPSNCADNPACTWYPYYLDPKGYGDAISATGVASGWVCDPDAPLISSKVRLAIWDGTPIGTFTADLSNEQAVTAECSGGSMHRFSIQLPGWARGQAVYAFAEDFVSGEVQIPWLCPGETWCAWQ